MYENLRLFLAEVPIFSRLLDAEVQSILTSSASSDDIKNARAEAHAKVKAEIKESQALYAVISFPDSVWTCPHCGEEIAGAYWELNNPITNKGLQVPLKLFHLFLDHGEFECLEPIENLSGQPISETILTIDLPGIARVMKGAWMPEDVKSEWEELL